MYVSITELYKHFINNPVACTDTRKLTKDCIFFALRGPSFNGNEFAEQAIKQGASYAIIDEPNFLKDDRYLLVNDVLSALQNLASLHRKTLNIPIIAITGSNGKTTTKELCKQVLSRKYNTFATRGNLNNHIGVPLSLLNITNKHQIAIIEMGANHAQEITQLCEIAFPDYGLITNIGSAHLEGFGSVDGILKAKSELFEHLIAYNGTIFLNTNDEKLNSLTLNHDKIIKYGSKADNFCVIKDSEHKSHLKVIWKLNNENQIYEAHSSLVGEYNSENIIASICVGSFFGVPATDINLAIRNYNASNNRSQMVIKNSNTIVLDAYNANPSSMMAALHNFKKSFDGKKIPVLGEMLELGNYTEKEHKKIFNELTKLGFDEFVLVGQHFKPFKNKDHVKYFNNADEARYWLETQNFKNASFLIKGSRATKMETVIEAFN